jgi:hypothetical protein
MPNAPANGGANSSSAQTRLILNGGIVNIRLTLRMSHGAGNQP